MKKSVMVLLTVFFTLSLLFAKGGMEGDGMGKNSNSANPKVLTVAIWDSNQERGLTKLMNDFTAATGIKVQIQVTPWDQYWVMLEPGATGGSLPDVFLDAFQ